MSAGKIIFIIFFILIVILFVKIPKKEVVYVKSDIDGESYLVRDLPDKQKAANMLARIKKNIFSLQMYLNENKDTKYQEYKPYIEQLTTRIKDVVINESTEDSVYTSYSVNKGEQIVFCLRSRDGNTQLHDLNLVMYVALHEIAHVACPEYGHGALFKKIFAFFTTVAIEQGIYHRIPFDKEPTDYCGLTISDSII
jgi:hypothetical protein